MNTAKKQMDARVPKLKKHNVKLTATTAIKRMD